ncbi:VPLPA-CTERM-specific exosortase XrtD [Teredinibacter turnerae]|uniref:VPLPA-CTERM-specific exosortase XrtD n=1 Tax=Teredinibacter turnerae TaxID=2426 RepID=UPI0003619CAD|nr:VPLPA-CTERM-specific exosortase XrtD [Teredinibacter turnerae]
MNAVASPMDLVRPQSAAHSLLVLFVLATLAFAPSLYGLVGDWLASPEYGHGILVSGIAGYLLWCRRDMVECAAEKPFAPAVVLVALALACYGFAMLGDITVLKHYAYVATLASIALTVGGWPVLRVVGFPLVLVFFSIPLHPFFTNHLTSDLQLVSSTIGVWFIHLMGIPALQEGNVINMGDFSLLVEEACSGLRYLLPLASISLLIGYYYRGRLITRILLFLSAIPITVFMNSLRIAVTGFLIKYVGKESADGFLHDFEGWFVFVVSCVLLGLALVVLAKVNRRALTLQDNFKFPAVAGEYSHAGSPVRARIHGVVAALLILGGGAISYLWLNKETVIPTRETFDKFPLTLAGRDLYPDVLDSHVLNILKLDDYFIGDYLATDKLPVNLYMAYYEAQQDGSLIHSPSDCIPAGGWEITDSRVIDLTDLGFRGRGNRAVIEKGDNRLLVYYWVNEQARNYATEFEVYNSLVLRSITHGRTDATLVRVYVPLREGVDSEGQLKEFVAALAERSTPFLPQ